MLSKHNLERLDRLKRRRNWIWMRIKKQEEEATVNKNLWLDKAEASALDWAIKYIEDKEENETTS